MNIWQRQLFRHDVNKLQKMCSPNMTLFLPFPGRNSNPRQAKFQLKTPPFSYINNFQPQTPPEVQSTRVSPWKKWPIKVSPRKEAQKVLASLFQSPAFQGLLAQPWKWRDLRTDPTFFFYRDAMDSHVRRAVSHVLGAPWVFFLGEKGGSWWGVNFEWISGYHKLPIQHG